MTGPTMTCCRCDRATGQAIRMTGLLGGLAPICAACLARDLVDSAERRRTFLFLVDNGVTRERASEIMQRRARR